MTKSFLIRAPNTLGIKEFPHPNKRYLYKNLSYIILNSKRLKPFKDQRQDKNSTFIIFIKYLLGALSRIDSHAKK